MRFSAVQAADVDDHGDYDVEEVDAFERHVVVGQPGVQDGGEGGKDKSQDGDEGMVGGALQVVRRPEPQEENNAREGEEDDNDQAGESRQAVNGARAGE